MNRNLGWTLSAVVVFAAPVASAQDAAAGAKKAEVCVECHGPKGNSTQGKYPILAGQTSRYIYLQLKDFKEGRRSHPDMTPMAKDLSREDMFDLAAYFSGQKLVTTPFKPDPARAAKGKAKADETLCTMCHLGGFMGQNEVPRVAGQQYDYVVKQLQDFKARHRTNDGGNMVSVASTLSDEDILNLANYLAGLY
jgi:cytochrome c553